MEFVSGNLRPACLFPIPEIYPSGRGYYDAANATLWFTSLSNNLQSLED